MIKFSIYQHKSFVGDLENNFNKIKEQYLIESKKNIDIFLLPELSLCGYPCGDLLLTDEFVRKSMNYVHKLVEISNETIFAITSIWEMNGKLYNAIIFAKNGFIIDFSFKNSLPNYGIFDEKRYFKNYDAVTVININGVKCGFLICEDFWVKDTYEKFLQHDIDIIFVSSASPYRKYVISERMVTLQKFLRILPKPVVFINKIGSQDEIVFDGSSFVATIDKNIFYFPQFKEDCQIISFDNHSNNFSFSHDSFELLDEYEMMYHAICQSLGDYLKNNGFKKIVIGLSGGVDSAIVAQIACDTIGSDNVKAFYLSTKYNTDLSQEIVNELARINGFELVNYPIDNIFTMLANNAKEIFNKESKRITLENLQSRIRSLLLLMVTNEEDRLLLTTGNKSEVAVGYCTIYGDMAGGYNPIKDIYKTEIYELCRYRNENIPSFSKARIKNIFSQKLLQRKASAELFHDQYDEDTLLPYEKLDALLYEFIERNLSVREVIENNYPYWENIEEDAKRIFKLIKRAKFKRVQAAPGPKISEKAFGLDRRYMLSDKFMG